MSIADLPPTSGQFAMPPFPVRRFSVAEYQHLTEVGLLQEDDSVELLEGWIVKKMTKNPLHDATVDLLLQMLGRLLTTGWFVRAQNVLLTSDSAPEPDLVIAPGKPQDYRRQHPQAHEVALVIEVADSSLDRDLKKRRLYANGGVRVYWIVDLNAGCLDVFTDPDTLAGVFGRHQRLLPPANATLLLADGAEITLSLAEVLPADDD
ncbi:MAG: Uma2 family endonuclease [Pirellulaceae bacterium]